jgi:hypothetical protein
VFKSEKILLKFEAYSFVFVKGAREGSAHKPGKYYAKYIICTAHTFSGCGYLPHIAHTSIHAWASFQQHQFEIWRSTSYKSQIWSRTPKLGSHYFGTKRLRFGDVASGSDRTVDSGECSTMYMLPLGPKL